METKKNNSGILHAIGYDEQTRTLQVQLDNGMSLQYCGVDNDFWRQLSNSETTLGDYCDNAEKESP